MLQIAPVELATGNLDRNYRELLIWAMVIPADDTISDEELAEEEHELARHIHGFHIHTAEYGEESFMVEKGKYRTAALLLYLSTIHGTNSFRLSGDDIAFIRNYFPPYIVADAQQNSDTKHTSLRALLSNGCFLVRVDLAIPH